VTARPESSEPFAKMARWWWRRLPVRVRTVSLTLAVALADGSYLRAWPVFGAVLPPLAVAIGLALGALHPGPVFSASAIVLAILALISGFGAGLGAWTWVGFVVGDLAFADRSSLPSGNIAFLGLGLVLIYVLVWVQLVVGPLLAVSSRKLLLRLPPRWRAALAHPAGLVIQVVVQCLFTVGWAHAAAFMIRPLWSYFDGTPDIADIQPLQNSAPWLGLIAALTTSVRLGLEASARRRHPEILTSIPPGGRPWPLGIRIVAQVALLWLLLSGLAGSVLERLALLVALSLVVITRLAVVPRLRRFVGLVARIPTLLRLIICLAVGFGLAQAIVVPAAASGTRSFASMLGVILGSMAVGAFLLPSPAPRGAQPALPPPAATPSVEAPT